MKNTKKKIDTLFSLARERGFSPMWTHYYRRDKKNNRVLAATSCILLDKKLQPVSRGLCSVYFYANGEKVYGRYESLKRAFKAALSKKTSWTFLYSGRIEGLRAGDQSCIAIQFSSNVDWIGCVTDVEYDRIGSKRERLLQNKPKDVGTATQGVYNSMVV